jgi:hypothetical protein
MHANPTHSQTDLEGLVAELTEAAYRVTLRHGFKGAFVDVELGLWHALRACQGRIEEFLSESPPTGPASGPHPSEVSGDTVPDYLRVWSTGDTK